MRDGRSNPAALISGLLRFARDCVKTRLCEELATKQSRKRSILRDSWIASLRSQRRDRGFDTVSFTKTIWRFLEVALNSHYLPSIIIIHPLPAGTLIGFVRSISAES